MGKKARGGKDSGQTWKERNPNETCAQADRDSEISSPYFLLTPSPSLQTHSALRLLSQ